VTAHVGPQAGPDRFDRFVSRHERLVRHDRDDFEHHRVEKFEEARQYRPERGTIPRYAGHRRSLGGEPKHGQHRAPLLVERADTGTLERLSVGASEARDLKVVIAPGLGDTDILGMNFLSQLETWRVEGRTRILVAKAGTATD